MTGLLSRTWSAPGATGDLDLSKIPAVTGGAAPVAVFTGNSVGAVATSLAVSLTARPHQPRAR